jgi:endonuclease YncB( thermonuclease family)
MRRKEKSKLMTILIVLALAGLSVLGKKLGWIDESGDFRSPSNDPGKPTSSSNPGAEESLGKYQLLRGCVLADDRNNDGDSFLVRHGRDEHVLRLYFVDCPEKRRHQYNGERIHEQAQYFKISDDAAIQTGLAAKDFTEKLLRKAPFDVATKWEEVYSSGRFYSFVMLPAESGKSSGQRYLCQELIKQGLGRIHTKGADLPTGTPWRKFRDQLRDDEARAKSARKGGWGQG